MLDLIHKVLYTGIGFAVLTEEKARDIVSDLEKKGEVSKEEGKQLAQDLIDKSKEHTEEFRSTIKTEIDKVAGKFGWVPRAEFDALKAKVEQLEARQPESTEETIQE